MLFSKTRMVLYDSGRVANGRARVCPLPRFNNVRTMVLSHGVICLLLRRLGGFCYTDLGTFATQTWAFATQKPTKMTWAPPKSVGVWEVGRDDSGSAQVIWTPLSSRCDAYSPYFFVNLQASYRTCRTSLFGQNASINFAVICVSVLS